MREEIFSEMVIAGAAVGGDRGEYTRTKGQEMSEMKISEMMTSGRKYFWKWL